MALSSRAVPGTGGGLQVPGAWVWGRRWPGTGVLLWHPPLCGVGGGPASTVMCVSDTAWELSHTLCWPRGQVAQGPQSPAFLLDTWTEFPD